jgi:hypothetical protein
MRSSVEESGVGRWTGYRLVRCVLGLVLLAAAALKAHQLATGPVAETDLLHSRWFLMIEVEFELLFGLWLLAGPYPRLTWIAALLLFTAFIGVSLYQIVSGEASCGCFGKVPVNPWYTFAFDVAAVLALLVWRPPRRSTPSDSGGRFAKLRAAAVVVVWLIAAIPTAIAMGSYTPTTVDPSGDILGEDSLVVLEPETWVGKPFPLSKHIDVGEHLVEGRWIVLLYHLDCPGCRQAMPRYVELSQELAQRPDCPKVAVIELPGHSSEPSEYQAASCLMGHLSRDREWFATTPVELRLDEGIVTQVTDAEELEFRAWQAPTDACPE